MGPRDIISSFFGFENFGPVFFLGRQKIYPIEHPYLQSEVTCQISSYEHER